MSTGLHAFGGGCRHLQPIDAIRQQTEWLLQLLTKLRHGCKTIGGMEWVSTPLCQDFWWPAIIYLNAEYSHSIEEGPCHWMKGGFIPSYYQARGIINTSNTKPRWDLVMRTCQNKKGVACEEYLSPKLPDCNEQLLKFQAHFTHHKIFACRYH